MFADIAGLVLSTLVQICGIWNALIVGEQRAHISNHAKVRSNRKAIAMDEYLEMAATIGAGCVYSVPDLLALLRRVSEREQAMTKEISYLRLLSEDLRSRNLHLVKQEKAFHRALYELKRNIPQQYVYGLMQALDTLEADNG